jgi:thiamine-phosphate pyrophosphorylase
MRLIPSRASPLLYLITDRSELPREENQSELAALCDFVGAAVAAGVDMIQVRERDLSARELFEIAELLSGLARRHDAGVLVNDRADVAACAGAGVHLTTRSMAPEVIRKAFGQDMLIGASTHSMEEAVAAESGGADFVVFGPVFETRSKKIYGPPVGLELLGDVARRLRIPVLALGGIDMTNFRLALERGAAGVAAISLFAKAADLRAVVEQVKNIP